MPSLRFRALSIVLASFAIVIAAGSTALAGPPTPSASKPRCTQGVTFRILAPTVARTRMVKVRSANIRRLPGVDCPLITSAKQGTRLAGTGRLARNGNSSWLEVRGKFGTGWVALTLVR